jgi:hypothetical protein
VYLDSLITHEDHEAWLVESGASFHMTPHREWLCEYERYDGGNVFLGVYSTTIIIGREKFKLTLIYGRLITLPSVMHIPGFSKYFIYVRKMDDAWVKTRFEKESCRMVRGEMVLLKGIWFVTLYRMQGSTINYGCNNSIILDIGVDEEINPTVTLLRPNINIA